MKEICEHNKCTGCGSCVSVCPKQCIHMEESKDGFLYPVINEADCIDCGLCQKSCKAEEKADKSFEKQAYAMKNQNEEVRVNSSSGGVFTLLSEYIISCGGAVYGAAFTDNYEVEHIRINTVEDIEKLRTSKYVQSRIGNCYQLAKKDLEENRMVLFTGTPCQIAGLKGYLKKEYDNLYCQDIMCHGVPSPKLWRKYIKELSLGTIQSVSFRDKTVSWSQFSMKITGDKGSICEKFFDNTYMKAFLADIALRESCTNCNFKELNYYSDLTLADFWGLDQVYPELDDSTGVSLVLVNSEKGQKLVEQISQHVKAEKVDLQKALQGNQPAITVTPPHRNRERFFADIDTKTVEQLVKVYVQGSLVKRVLRKLLRR